MGKIFSHIFSQIFKARMTTASTARLQSHCKVSVRASEACSGLQQASQISGNYTACWRMKNRDRRKEGVPRATHYSLPPSSVHPPSTVSSLTELTMFCSLFHQQYACSWPLPRSLYTGLPPETCSWPHWCSHLQTPAHGRS